MLRVYSILYLEQVWSRPATEKVVAAVQEEEADATTEIIANECEANEQEQVSCYGTVNIVSSTSIQRQEQVVQEVADQEDEMEVDTLPSIAATMEELSCSNSSINTNTDNKANSLLSLPPPPSRSETPLTQHHEEVFFPTSKVDREYYDDDICSETEEDDDSLPKQQLPITPPSTPNTNKFYPKRMLHRAKSSINDESVRNLGRRTSLFLEKFNQIHQQQQAASTTLPPTNKTNIKEDISKGLRRQSSKLTVKGKTLTKKLKRALSFHQPS